MSEDHVKFLIGGEVAIEVLADAFSRFCRVLEALSESHSADVRWVLAGLDYGSAAATARAVPLDDEAQQRIPAMYDNYVEAALRVRDGNADGEFPLHRQMHELMALANETHPIMIQTDGKQVVVEAPIAPLNPSVAGDPKEDPLSLGTVRGRVETLSRRRGLSFYLYELATDAAVTCYMDWDLEDTMREVWGRIADVTGSVRRDAKTDRPLWIRRVTNVDPVDEGDPDGYRRARGALNTSEPAEVLVRRMRDAEARQPLPGRRVSR